MVKLYSIVMMNFRQENAPDILYSSFELSDVGFFKRTVVKDLCIFASTESIKRSLIGKKTSLENQSLICYSYIIESGLAAACVTDMEYPSRIAYDFLDEALKIYSDKQCRSSIDALLQNYQDVNKVDKIYAIKSELEGTIKICQDTINKLFIRDEELQDIIQKTENLSDQSKIFAIEARKLNSCCILF